MGEKIKKTIKLNNKPIADFYYKETDKTIINIRLLKTSGVRRIKLVTNINAANIKRVHKMNVLRDKLDIELTYNVFAQVGRGNEQKYLVPLNRDLIEFFLKETRIINCDTTNAPNLDYLDIYAGVSCGSGTHMVSADCRGNVFPCHLFHKPEFCIGNLLAQPNLVEMLEQSPVACQFRARTVETRKCHGCDVEYFCKGGCLAHAINIHKHSKNSWLERDPFCEVHKKILSVQMWPNS